MKIEHLSKKIVNYYPKMKEIEHQLKLLKAVFEKKYVELGNEDFAYDGLKFQYKKHTNWKIREQLKDELEARDILHLGISIPRKTEIQYDISRFRLEPKKYVKINSKPLSKDLREEFNEQQEDFDLTFLEKWENESFDDIINYYRSLKNTFDELQKSYKNHRKELLYYLSKESSNKIFVDDIYSFSVLEKSPEYNVEKMTKSYINKNFLFIYSLDDYGNIVCFDYYKNEHFAFQKSIIHDGHKISFRKGVLYVDRKPLNNVSLGSDELHMIKKSDKKTIEKNKQMIACGKKRIRGFQFFRSQPISSTKVQSLIEEGKIQKQVFDMNRFIDSEEDISLRFEVIEDDVDNLRKAYFVQRLIEKAQNLR